MKKKQKVGILEEKQAIDFTPIYYIRLEKTVRKGQLLEIDMADKEVIISRNTNA